MNDNYHVLALEDRKGHMITVKELEGIPLQDCFIRRRENTVLTFLRNNKEYAFLVSEIVKQINIVGNEKKLSCSNVAGHCSTLVKRNLIRKKGSFFYYNADEKKVSHNGEGDNNG